eukprot:732084-Prorocentrum_lima.AAC.1
MTSSLVGSEMCIRDRNQRLESPVGIVHALGAVGANCLTIIMPFANVAVSYTHLTLPTICSV